ncbi:MAG TPA: lysylphosphatidylglycerol synthase transmembrane domain-containing protein, partial [Polyangiales bacterium]|nr:lysylphosphatidylglycerol synthase transmembrane domain-containing protein [Polyangiales bacterium]
VMDQEVYAQSGAPESSESPAKARGMITRLIASLVIGVSLYLVLRELGLEFVPSAESLAQLDAGAVCGFAGLWLIATFLRVYRFVHLLRPLQPSVSPLRTIGVGLLGFAALFAPMRMGEVARPLLVARDKKITFVQAAGTVVAERIVDGLMLTTLLAIGLWFAPPVSPLPEGLGDTKLPLFLVLPAAQLALLIFVSAFIAMALFYFWRSFAHRLVFNVVGAVSKPLATKVTTQVERVSDSLQFLMSRQHGLRFLRDTTAYWLLSACAFVVLLRGAGAPASFFQAAAIMGVLGLSTTLPGPPGFLGTYQFGASCGIALFFPQLATAAALFTFVSYCAQIITAVLSLLLGLWVMSITKPAQAQVVQRDPGFLPSAPPSSSVR